VFSRVCRGHGIAVAGLGEATSRRLQTAPPRPTTTKARPPTGAAGLGGTAGTKLV